MLTPREVSESMTFRQWLAICSMIDSKYGRDTKFDVLCVEQQESKRVVKIRAIRQIVEIDIAA